MAKTIQDKLKELKDVKISLKNKINTVFRGFYNESTDTVIEDSDSFDTYDDKLYDSFSNVSKGFANAITSKDNKIELKKDGTDTFSELIDAIGKITTESKVLPKREISVISDNVTMGTVNGSGEYEIDEVITISATANENYEFKNWSDGNTDNPRQITVVEDKEYVASFQGIQFTIPVNYTNITYIENNTAKTKSDSKNITARYGDTLTKDNIDDYDLNNTNSKINGQINTVFSYLVNSSAAITVECLPKIYEISLVYNNDKKTVNFNYGDMPELDGFGITEDDIKVDGYTYTIPTFTIVTGRKTYTVTYTEEEESFYFCTSDTGEDVFKPGKYTKYTISQFPKNNDNYFIRDHVSFIVKEGKKPVITYLNEFNMTLSVFDDNYTGVEINQFNAKEQFGQEYANKMWYTSGMRPMQQEQVMHDITIQINN